MRDSVLIAADEDEFSPWPCVSPTGRTLYREIYTFDDFTKLDRMLLNSMDEKRRSALRDNRWDVV